MIVKDLPPPGKAFIEIHKKEMAATKYEDLLPLRSKESIAKDAFNTPAERAVFFPLFKAMLVKEFQIVDERIENDKAVVHAVSEHHTGNEIEKTTGEIHLVWEDGAWKLEREKWETKTEVK